MELDSNICSEANHDSHFEPSIYRPPSTNLSTKKNQSLSHRTPSNRNNANLQIATTLQTILLPRIQLHSSLLLQIAVHVKGLIQHMRLMTPSLLQTFKLRAIKVILQNWSVVGMRALLDDFASTLTGSQAADIGEALFRDNDVEVVFRLVDMCAHGHDTGDAGGVGLGGTGGGSVHDGVFGAAEEVGAAAEAVEHTGSHDAG